MVLANNRDMKSGGGDPVLRRRTRIARLAQLGRRAGYGLYGVSLALFGLSLAIGLRSSALVALAAVALIAGSVALAPAVIVGYAVKAADRADREDSW